MGEGHNVEQVAAEIRHPPGYRFRRGQNWFLVGLTYASYYMCRYNIYIVAPRIMDAFGLNNFQFGIIDTARNWCYSIGQFVNGLFTDRLGGKQAMLVGAVLTIILNIAFGTVSLLATSLGTFAILVALATIRGLDGYSQAFGAPGMVKINTAWFPRAERGRFAGVFGMMIQFGNIAINSIGPFLLTGLTIPLVFGVVKIPAHWQNLFFLPPVAVAVITTLMFIFARNHPEEAGYQVQHAADEDHANDDHDQKLPLRVIFKTVASKPMVWVTACAYFCTGVVRTAVNTWWVVYFDRQWGLDIATSTLVVVTGALLPITAVIGSISSGVISDLLFRGRRAPVACGLYLLETGVILAAALLLSNSAYATPLLASVMLMLISLTANSTHSILGTAAAMDLGGRKMAGFAAGVIDSFQYIGAGLAGIGLGLTLDSMVSKSTLGWSVWFFFMAPFSGLGTLLMAYVWYATHGRSVRG
ncbi:MAG: MFS transporter, partial [Planctomycetota bacterium]